MRIEYSRGFKKDYKNCSENIKKAFRNRLRMFEKNKFDPLLIIINLKAG